MANNVPVVENDMVVSLAYELALEDGTALEQTDGDELLHFIQGQQQIIPGLENALYGMHVGEEKTVVVEPDQGYGLYDEEDFDVMPRSAFPADLELEVGTPLRLRDQVTGEGFTAYVAEINSDNVLLDFNHPLAGETLHFRVRVAGVRQATPQELDQGLPE